MMRKRGRPKSFPILLACVLLILPVAVNFLGQNSSPSPASSPEPSPAASVSPTVAPVRTPSPTPLPGAQNFHQWGSITVFNGLPSDSVRAIAQTPDGVMWFGTDNGLARFDGRRIQNFSLGSENSDRITSLRIVRTGDLWIGTQSGAFVRSGDEFQSVDSTQGIGITSLLDLHDFYNDETTVYLGTDGGIVMLASTSTPDKVARVLSTEPIRDSNNSPMPITSLVVLAERIIAGTPGGGIFHVWPGGSNAAFSTFSFPMFVNSLVRGKDGILWIGSDAAKGASGIYAKWDDKRAERISAPTANVLSVEANDGGLWAGTERYGLFQIVEGKLKKAYTFENTSGGLRSDTIYTLFTDREGVIWIGTNRGVSRFDRIGASQQAVSDTANSNFVRTLWSNGRALYAGSNRGLFEFQYSDEIWNKVTEFEERVIYDISVSDQGIVVGTPSGAYDRRGRSIISGDTRSIEYFGKATYAAIVGRGVVNISNPRQDVVFATENATALLAAPDRLWIGTGGIGLFSFDGKTTKSEFGPEVLKAGTIWKMSWGLDGTIWIAGQHGVFRVANGQVEQVIEVEDVRDVYVDNSDIWAATTTRGLVHARRHERFGWVVSSIGFEQGLPSEKAFSIVQGEGLLVATNRGVVTYKPGLIPPKLIATRIISQRVHDLAEARALIDLEYPQNSILVEVAGQSSRTFPEEFQYGFILKNAKGEIMDNRISNESQYAPADLKAGNYAIEAIAFNRDLLASDPLVINFSVAKAPFPWTSAALAALLAIAVIALIWAIVERRRIVIRNRELAAARFDLASEAERERSRIARDLHDQTLADLRGLIMKSDKELPPDAGFREEIESISTEVRRICEDLSPSVLENVGLIASLEFLLGHSVENYTFDSGETTEEDVHLPMNVQLQIYRIAQEVLANIKQHAEATVVSMEVAASDQDGFELTIENDGRTFTPPEHNLRGGRGIAGIRSRAALINATVSWTEVPDRRQIFNLKLASPAI